MTANTNKRLNLILRTLAIAAICLNAAGAQAQFFKIENPHTGIPTGSLGQSIAVDGDTMVVGAPHTDVSGMQWAGVARIFVSDGQGGWDLQGELFSAAPVGSGAFGYSVAISGDTVAIGGNTGDAAVFTRSGGVWTQEATLVAWDVGSAGRFGISVSLSGDTVVVGADHDNDAGNDAGAAYVFIRSGANWSGQQKLIASDAAAGDHFGFSTAISGETILVGADDHGGGGVPSGAAYVFTRSGAAWSEQRKLAAFDTLVPENFGFSVAVSADTAVVGTPYVGASGEAYVFIRSGGVWSDQQKLTPSGAVASEAFGNAVSISGDTIVVGAHMDNRDTDWEPVGSAYVFTRSADVWTEQQRLFAPDAAREDEFGNSVSVSGDTIVVGAPLNDVGDIDAGSAYAFKRSGSSWTLEAKVPGPPRPARGDNFSSSVGISGDTVIIGGGAPYARSGGNGAGAAHVFVRSGDTWLLEQELVPSESWQTDYFGYGVSISGDTAFVAGWKEQSGGLGVFTRSGGVWALEQTFAPDTESSEWFGSVVAVSGDLAVVDGGPGYEIAAYVFTRSAGVWTQQGKLSPTHPGGPFPGMNYVRSLSVSGDSVAIGVETSEGLPSSYKMDTASVFTRSGDVWTEQVLGPSNPEAEGRIGRCVSISGDTVIVATNGFSSDGPSFGSAYVFTRSGGIWSEQTILTPDDPADGEFFGDRVGVSGDTAVVGAKNSDGGAGSVYVFVRSGTDWSQLYKLMNPDPGPFDGFSLALAVDAGHVLVGAPAKDDPETGAGAAYVFALPAPARAQRHWTLY